MKLRTSALFLEAVAAAGPCTVALTYGLPVMVSLGMAALLENPRVALWGLLQLAGCTWAMIEFWRLALRTVFAVPYLFGSRFWVAVLGAGAGLVGFVGAIPASALVVLVGLPGLAVAHFSYLQLAARRSGIAVANKS